MTNAPFKTQEEMNKFIADAQVAMKSFESLTERTAKAEQLAGQLQAGMDEMKRAQTQANNRPATPDDISIERAYTATSVSRAEMAHRGGVANLGDEPVNDKRNRQWLGSKGGCVKLIGSLERGRWKPGLLDDPAPKSDWQIEAQAMAEEMAWVRAFRGQASADQIAGFRDHMLCGPDAVRKVFADNATEGGEFIVTIPMAMLERTAEMDRLLEAQIPSMSLSATTQTMPFLTTGVQPFLHNVPAAGDNSPTDIPKSVPTTAERTVTSKTLAVDVPIDRDAIEDSIIAAIPLLQQLVGEALRDGTEDALINGDSTATHGDTAFATWNPRSRWTTLGSSLDHRRAWIGFRHRAIDVSSTVDQTATQTVAGYIAALAGLTVPHAFGDIVYITSPEHYLAKILVDTNLLTVDKYGPGATIITGEVGRIGGHPLVLSEFVTPDLAATGLYTGSGALTGLLIANLRRFVMARRRSLRIEVETVVRQHTTYVVASERKTLHTFDGSSTKNVRWLYNLAIS